MRRKFTAVPVKASTEDLRYQVDMIPIKEYMELNGMDEQDVEDALGFPFEKVNRVFERADGECPYVGVGVRTEKPGFLKFYAIGMGLEKSFRDTIELKRFLIRN